MNKSECQLYSDGIKQWWFNNLLHKEDGSAVEGMNGHKGWCLNGEWVYPEFFVNDPELKKKYPKLIEVMNIYLVHKM